VRGIRTWYAIRSTLSLTGMGHLELSRTLKKDHRDDDQSADPVSQRERNRAGHQKHDDERIAEEADEPGGGGSERDAPPS